MGPSHEPRRPARRHPEEPVPEVRPFRALRFDRSVVGDPGLVVAPPYDVIGPELRATLEARHPANVVRLDLPVEELGRRARRPLPARGADPRRLALGRDAAQGPASVGLRLRADLRGARARTSSGPSAGSSRGSGSSRSGRSRASCRTSGRWPAPGRTATSCSARPASTRARSSRCSRTIPATTGAAPGLRGRGPARSRGRPTTTASAIACGPCRPTATARPAEIAAALIAAAAARPGHDRRRAPPLRDGAAVPRRAPDEPVVRGGSGVRLPADAVPRGDRRAADGPADASARDGS